MEAIIDEYILRNTQTNERYKDYYKYIIEEIIEIFNILFNNIDVDDIYNELNSKYEYKTVDHKLNIVNMIISFLENDGSTEYEFCIEQIMNKFKQETYNFLQFLNSTNLNLLYCELYCEKYNKYTIIKNRCVSVAFLGNLSYDQLHIELSLNFSKKIDDNTLNIYFSNSQYDKFNDVIEYKKFIQYYDNNIAIHNKEQFSEYIEYNCNMNDKCSCKDKFYFEFEFNYIFTYVKSHIFKYQNNLHYVKKFVGDRPYINIEKIHCLQINDNTIYLIIYNI